MSLRLLSIAVIISLITVRAEAIEMFTNFHNGENIGFPPMQVPIRMYPGFGRGGWAPGVVGAPLRTVPPVPAMSPNGPATPTFQRGEQRPGQFETGMNSGPQQGLVVARNGRRRATGYFRAPADVHDPKPSAAASTPAETPRGLTVLKPQTAVPPDLGGPSVVADSIRPSANAGPEAINADRDSSAFFQNATSGW